MDNRTKQSIALLEARIQRLENTMLNISWAINSEAQTPLSCAQCGITDPIRNGVICGQVDCCMGLNPSDDERN